jgi:hypothetical protein
MLEHAILRERFEELWSAARHSHKLCQDLSASVEDPSHRELMEQLLRDKQRNLYLTERLLEIVA